eukprot:CAMPEP_0172440316 /NCGR_PEP_ID=MMETSP1065-20121228/974_1 /TAXON_ID=265537 /ORGANISM="Amphiprora paludosa, Strain CCMP125" /LENGTH=419 /DNA_ID=CAMNT_0013189103 /DNA_START=736 /DNA_END=1995 /DNA_ORIENTATION=-
MTACLVSISLGLAPSVGPPRRRLWPKSTPHQVRSPALEAVSIRTEGDERLTIIPIHTNGKKAWPRRLIGKVFRRDRRNRRSSSVPHLSASTHSFDLINVTDSYILRDYQTLAPSQVLPLEILDSRISQSPGLSLDVVDPDASGRASPPLSRVTGKWGEATLTSLFDRWSEGSHENLQVNCDPNGGVVDYVKGQFGLDATVEFDRMAFKPIRLSKGKIKSHRLALNYFKYAPFCRGIPRFTSAFDLEAHDLTLTQKDLFESPCIRHGLRSLLTRILRNRGMTASRVGITSLVILPSGKLSCSGYATVFDSKVEFEVRTGLGVQNRGHVLSFPGLEISLSPAVGLFVPVVPPISLDMGHNARITKVSINGKDRTLKLSCRATITPRHTRKQLKYQQSTNAYAASFHFDVGNWLTRIGKFSE